MMRRQGVSKFLMFAMTSALLLLSLLFFISSQPKLRQQVAFFPSSVLNWFHELWQGPANLVENLGQQVEDLMGTYEDNQRLKARLTSLANQEDRIKSLEEDNKRLRESLDIKAQYVEQATIATEVLVRSSVAWLDELTVDKGSQDGVSKGMLLVSSEGLVGHITLLGSKTSQIQLVTNTVSSSAIPVKIEGDEPVYGIFMGYDSERKLAKISQLNSQSDISVDRSVVTSGLDGETPAGLLLGRVESVERASDQSRVVYVTLAADTKNLKTLSFVGRD